MAIYTLEYMPCKLIFGLSIISHFDYFIIFLNIIWRTGNYLHRFINNKQYISHSLLGSKKSARFCKHHLNKCHL
jgi:hypothetical protein